MTSTITTNDGVSTEYDWKRVNAVGLNPLKRVHVVDADSASVGLIISIVACCGDDVPNPDMGISSPHPEWVFRDKLSMSGFFRIDAYFQNETTKMGVKYIEPVWHEEKLNVDRSGLTEDDKTAYIRAVVDVRARLYKAMLVLNPPSYVHDLIRSYVDKIVMYGCCYPDRHPSPPRGEVVKRNDAYDEYHERWMEMRGADRSW